MAQTTVNIRMDDQLIKQMEQLCSEFGMSLSTAMTVFAKAVVRERRMPFEISADSDPFYSKANMRHVEKGMRDFAEGRPGVLKTMEDLENLANG
jgi:DNA-damage-inducible protein J